MEQISTCVQAPNIGVNLNSSPSFMPKSNLSSRLTHCMIKILPKSISLNLQLLPRATISFIFCLDNYNDLSPPIYSAFSCNLYSLPYSFICCLSHLLHHLLLSSLLGTLQAHLSLIYLYQRFQHSKHVPSLMALMIFSIVLCMAGSPSSSKSISNIHIDKQVCLFKVTTQLPITVTF